MAWRVSDHRQQFVKDLKNSPSHSAALLYFALMLYIVLGILNEVRPMWFYILAALLFVLSQLDFFLLNKVICQVRDISFAGRVSTLTYGHRDRVYHHTE